MIVNNIQKNIKIIIYIFISLIILKLALVFLIPKEILHCNERAKILSINKYSLKGNHYYIRVKTLDSNKEFEFSTTKQNYYKYNIDQIIDINYLSLIFDFGETDGNVRIIQ